MDDTQLSFGWGSVVIGSEAVQRQNGVTDTVFARHCVLNVDAPLYGDAVVLPFADRLRRQRRIEGAPESGLRPGNIEAKLQRLKTGRGRVQILGRHGNVVRLQLTDVNSSALAKASAVNYHQPMVYAPALHVIPPPSEYQSFADWIKSIYQHNYGAGPLLGKLCGLKGRAGTHKWLRGTIPKRETLEALAGGLKVPLPELLALVSREQRPAVAMSNELLLAFERLGSDEERLKVLASLQRRVQSSPPPALRRVK